MKDHIAVLIPCYNESRTIEKVVRDFKRMLPEATVYVYDNNSSDGTGEIAARVCTQGGPVGHLPFSRSVYSCRHASNATDISKPR